MTRDSRLVYSTDKGRIKPDTSSSETIPTGDGIVRLRRETKGRKGKGVTLVDGVPESADRLKALAKELKQLCGTGGSVKDGVIEIQGDHRDRIKPALEAKGYNVKLAGG
jgi:translation initiation factor 1